MTKVLSKIMPAWKTETIQAGFSTGSPTHHSEFNFDLPPPDPIDFSSDFVDFAAPSFDSEWSPPPPRELASSADLAKLATATDSLSVPPVGTASASTSTASSTFSPQDASGQAANQSSSSVSSLATSGNKRPASSPERSSAPHPKKPKKSKNPAPNGRSRWTVVVSDLMPPANPVWANVLHAVGKALRLTGHEKPTVSNVEVANTWWMLPEAAMIASIQKERTQALSIENICRFLRYFEYIICHFTDPSIHPDKFYFPNSKWRLILAATEADTKTGGSTAEAPQGSKGPNESEASVKRTHASVKRTEVRRTLEVMLKLCKVGDSEQRVDFETLINAAVVWEGTQIAPAGPHEPALPSPGVCKRILALLCEVNFRLEILALDFFCYNPMNNHSKRVRDPQERREDVIALMPWNRGVFPEDVSNEEGWSAQDIEKRWDATYGLVMVMQDWVRVKQCSIPGGLIDLTHELVFLEKQDKFDIKKFEALERGVIEHYIRAYAFVFQRAPSIPYLAVPRA
ncbi:hypothetical protein CYLTODRAFT_233416 [Cylindrobasidium torrendii FP15055 ss-10]|uniref:Uncharacterized protein n=1 Tax=Cylindrobasidium torrendii FP15055 ss-10 TaxID=1314674 RepID=A0A0D7ATV4_9AGAR|nr:hypothetical protein CYLTODRAFT_233416 [Cylindrobasidium torrendii FP15055 ss-10]